MGTAAWVEIGICSDQMKTTYNFQSYEEKGFLRIRNLISEPIVQELKAELEKLLVQESGRFTSKLFEATFAEDQINSIHCLKKIKGYRFEEIFSRTGLQDVVSALLGRSAYCLTSESFLKPQRIGKKVFPHQDDEYFCLREGNGVNVVIALDRATQENGAIYYYPGSHRLGPLGHQAIGLKTYVIEEKHLAGRERVFQDVEAGDCILHHPWVIHGSEPNTSSFPRKTITRLYSSFEDGLDQGRARLRFKQAFASLLLR